jgi:hypothetical protein
MQQESSLPPARPGDEDEPVVHGAETFNRAQTASGGFTAPGETKRGDPVEDTKEIDVDVDVLASEPEEVDVALETQELEVQPVRSFPPPPPKAAMTSRPPPKAAMTSQPPPPPKRRKSSMPPPPPRKNG